MADQTVQTTKTFGLVASDFFKGLIMAVGGAVFTVLENSINAGSYTFDWTNVWHVSLGAFILYIGKNFFTPAQTVITGVTPGSTLEKIQIPLQGKKLTL